MKQLLSLALVLFALFFQGCQDNLNVPTPASRNYEQDAIVLNEFVDINKMTMDIMLIRTNVVPPCHI